MCVQALNGTDARWLLRVKHDGEQVETVLQINLQISCVFCEYSELSIFRFWRDRPKQTKNVRQRKIQNTTFFKRK
jgi:hypothetical protein